MQGNTREQQSLIACMENGLIKILNLPGLEKLKADRTLPHEFFNRFKEVYSIYDKLRETVLEKEGIKPICKSECAACCYYLPSGISDAEMVIMYDGLTNTKDPNIYLKAHLENCLSLTNILEKNYPPETKKITFDLKDSHMINSIRDYVLEKNLCGFVENSKCAIYDERPMNCRAHYQFISEKHCHPDTISEVGILKSDPGGNVFDLLMKIDHRLDLGLTPILPRGVMDLLNILDGRNIKKV